MIYVLQAEIGGPVKVGYTAGDDVRPRIRALQCGSPFKLVLLATLAGDASVERTLHMRFAEHRLHGEWFSPVPEVARWVAGVSGCIPRRDVEMPELAVRIGAPYGPLTRQYQVVLDAVPDGRWVRSRDVVSALGSNADVSAVPIRLRNLYDRGRLDIRTVWVAGGRRREYRLPGRTIEHERVAA